MKTDAPETPSVTLPDDAWALLHEVRLRGFLPALGVAREEALLAAGLVVARGANLALTPAGREAHAGWARLTPGSPEEAAARAAYERFLVLNNEFLRICTDWQLKPGSVPNNHDDAAYDWKILERLDRLDERVGGVLTALGDAAPRFAGYRARLTEALDRISADKAWLASPRCDSYHTVWMQLHEDLLGAVGVNRADEAPPG